MFSKAFFWYRNPSSSEHCWSSLSSILPPLTMSSPLFCLRAKGVVRVKRESLSYYTWFEQYIWTTLFTSCGCLHISFFLALPLDKAVLTFRGMGKSQFHRAYNPSTAGHAVFSFHISVSSQLLEPSQRKDIFVPGVFCQGKPGYSKFLFLS